jgi:hypothetical protein
MPMLKQGFFEVADVVKVVGIGVSYFAGNLMDFFFQITDMVAELQKILRDNALKLGEAIGGETGKQIAGTFAPPSDMSKSSCMSVGGTGLMCVDM